MRLFHISILGIVAISAATAGQIEIGGGSSNGISSQGLTAAYIATATQTGNAWAGEKGPYVSTLFGGATITASTLNGISETSAVGTGTASSTPNYQSGFQQFTDPNNGVTFAMLDDAANGNNYLSSASGVTTGPTSITVPVNVSGVDNAYVLLDEFFGVNGSLAQNDTVTFNFNGGATTDAFTLINGNQIGSAVACSATSTTWTGTGDCATYAHSASSTSTDVAWSGSYTNTGSNMNVFSGTTGTLNLYDLTFNISAYAGDTLTSVTITDNNNGSNSSRLALSALTVATPEPSTIMLLLAGLGILVFVGQRRKAVL